VIYYRLRPGKSNPSFQPGRLYPYLRDTHPKGYIFLELAGKPRCVWSNDFEKVRDGSRTLPTRTIKHPNQPIRRLK